MNYKIIVLPDAENDLICIGDYITSQLHSSSTAINIITGIESEINKLHSNPLRHELSEDEKLACLGIRRQYFKNYKIFYSVDSEKCEIYILRILHMRVDSYSLFYQMRKKER